MSQTLYRVNYINQNEVYELYAKQIDTDRLLGFVSLLGLEFDVNAGVLIDPVEERMKAEFKDVTTLHIPIGQVIKIEEVKRKGMCKIRPLEANLRSIKQPGNNP